MTLLCILRPSNANLRKRIIRCPICECMTEFVVRYETWYGNTFMCCRCGDSWSDGELLERPFKPGWRREAVAHHRKLWNQAPHGPDPTLEELDPEWFAEIEGGEQP